MMIVILLIVIALLFFRPLISACNTYSETVEIHSRKCKALVGINGTKQVSSALDGLTADDIKTGQKYKLIK